MKALRVILAVASVCLANSAGAEIHTLVAAQKLNPPNGLYPQFGEDVAIDGGFIIVLAKSDTGHAAFLYRRDLSTGKFAYQYSLLALATAADATGDVAMKNGIAAIRMGNEIRIFEHSGANYVHAHSATPLTHPGGIAISGNSVLVGGDGCTDDAVVYQKGADGNWGIAGRLDDHQGACHPEGLQVDLNYDYALLSARGDDHATAWHRDSAGNWTTAGTLTLPSGSAVGDFPFALENMTAVSPGNHVFRRSGSSWTRTGRFIPVNFDATAHTGAYQVVDRDGVLVTIEPHVTAAAGAPDYPVPYAYLETTPGHFDQVAMMNAGGLTQRVDVSARTVVAASGGGSVSPDIVQVFYLPTPLMPPSPIVNDFESQDVSGLSFDGGQFIVGLVNRGVLYGRYLLEQNTDRGMAVAVANDSDWTGYQKIEADIQQADTSNVTWCGPVLRYVDANNFYYGIVQFFGTSSVTYSIHKRIDGVDTLLKAATRKEDLTTRRHFEFLVDGSGNLALSSDDVGVVGATDTTLTHGRAGFASFMTVCDFDNLHIAGTEFALFPLFRDEIVNDKVSPVDGKKFSTVGGHWVKQFSGSFYEGISQETPVGDALAFIGVPVEDQSIYSIARVDSFNSSTTGGWFGLLARYQDSKNYYYAAIRSTNRIQIRKVVNGVITVLASEPFTAVPGQDHLIEFQVINDELRLFVDQKLVARANDDSFTSGQYGIGTHSATATWRQVQVSQP